MTVPAMIATQQGVSAATSLANAAISVWAVADDVGNDSLTKFLKPAFLHFRSYIDGALETEEVLPDILKTMHTICTGLVLNAFKMQQFVVDGKRVRDLLNTVSVEAVEHYESIVGSFEQFAAMELNVSVNPSTDGLSISVDAEPVQPMIVSNGTVASKYVMQAEDSKLPIGTTIEVTIGNPKDPSRQANLNITIKLVPYIVRRDAALQFITSATATSWAQRWLQYKAGEIAFFKDLIFGQDLISKRAKAADASPEFAEFMDQVIKKDRKKVHSIFLEPQGERSRNVASNVMIFHADTVKRAKAENGIDLTKENDRNRFFRHTYTMALLVVDPLYNEVTMYLNGIHEVGRYSFSHFRGPRKGLDPADLVTAMVAMSQGKAPRF